MGARGVSFNQYDPVAAVAFGFIKAGVGVLEPSLNRAVVQVIAEGHPDAHSSPITHTLDGQRMDGSAYSLGNFDCLVCLHIHQQRHEFFASGAV